MKQKEKVEKARIMMVQAYKNNRKSDNSKWNGRDGDYRNKVQTQVQDDGRRDVENRHAMEYHINLFGERGVSIDLFMGQ